jgi:predicted alpha-1,6-mannanase (GH76 family)
MLIGLICAGDGGLFSGIAISFISQVIRFNSQAGQEQTCCVKNMKIFISKPSGE